MASDKKDESQSNSEITVSATGVTVKGQLVDSLSKPVMRIATTADSVLRFCSSLVVLPFDFMSHNLESFRRRYAHKFEEIPFEHRQEPSARIAATAIQQAALSADAPDIQEMFPNCSPRRRMSVFKAKFIPPLSPSSASSMPTTPCSCGPLWPLPLQKFPFAGAIDPTIFARLRAPPPRTC